MKKLLLVILLPIAISLQSCDYVVTKIFKETPQADDSTKTAIALLNKTLMKSLENNDLKGVKSVMSNRLILKLDSNFEGMIGSFYKVYGTKMEYEMLDGFYTQNENAETSTSVTSSKAGGYKLKYVALNEETYASVLVTKNAPVNCLVLAIYGKYDDKWKLNILELTDYNAFGKNAPDYYKEAQKEYKDGNLIDAVDDIVITKQLATPLDKYIVYNDNEAMQAFYNKVLTEANTKYKLPYAITSVKQHPQIFSISPQMITSDEHRGIYPMIRYRSNISLKDTVALKKENNDMQKIIGQLYKGIDKRKNYILYAAYNNIPDGKSPGSMYGFVQRLSK